MNASHLRMTRDQAQTYLSSRNSHERLMAARYFAKNALPDDREMLARAYNAETLSWIKRALLRARSAASDATIEVTEAEELGQDEIDVSDVYARAIEETTRALLHEVRPSIGLLKASAEQDIGENFAKSGTLRELNRLSTILESIDLLGRAASQAVMKEFDLGLVIEETSQSIVHGVEIKVLFAGPRPFLVIGDSCLIAMAFANGLRNAIEAMNVSEAKASDLAVVVNWGVTDVEYWIAILDRGIGIQGSGESLFEIGTTSKVGHVGMGLALARRAVQSMRGDIKLTPRGEGGTQFLISWPANPVNK